MKNLFFTATFAGLAMVTSPASAAVRYGVTIISTDPSLIGESFSGHFAYVAPAFFSEGMGVALPASYLSDCLITGTVSGPFSCGSAYLFADFGGNSEIGVTLDRVTTGFIVPTLVFTFPGTTSFLSAGTYNTRTSSLNKARLTVIDLDARAVPEPTSWAMMITGFGMVGGALRNRNSRRRVTKVTYA